MTSVYTVAAELLTHCTFVVVVPLVTGFVEYVGTVLSAGMSRLSRGLKSTVANPEKGTGRSLGE